METHFTLRVETEQLRKQKAILDDDLNNMKNDITKITNDITGTSGYWLGEAGNKQRSEYENNIQNINNMLDRLGKYPVRILEIAGILEKTEKENKIRSEPLPDVQLF